MNNHLCGNRRIPAAFFPGRDRLVARSVPFICLCLAFLWTACDGGLEPADKPVISGTVTYVGGADAWPPADSIREVRVVAFRSYPPEDIIGEVLGERAYFTQQSLPPFADTSSYVIELPSPAPDRIAAVVAALRYGDNIMADWRVIGVYTTSGDQSEPTALDLSGSARRDINITVDFDNPPPQPF